MAAVNASTGRETIRAPNHTTANVPRSSTTAASTARSRICATGAITVARGTCITSVHCCSTPTKSTGACSTIISAPSTVA